MNGKHLWSRLLYTVAAVGGGIIGGMLSDYARHSISPATAQTSAASGQIVSTNEFRLLDEDRRVRARLFLENTVPELALYDWHGDKVVSLTGGLTGGELILSSHYETEKQEQVRLRVNHDGGELNIGRNYTSPDIDLSVSKITTGLSLASTEDHKRAIEASVDYGSVPSVLLRDEKGEARSALGLDQTGNPDISLFDAKKRTRADLKLDTDGNPSLTLNDAKQTRAVLGSSYLKNTTTGSTEHRSLSSLVLFREDGKLLWRAP